LPAVFGSYEKYSIRIKWLLQSGTRDVEREECDRDDDGETGRELHEFDDERKRTPFRFFYSILHMCREYHEQNHPDIAQGRFRTL